MKRRYHWMLAAALQLMALVASAQAAADPYVRYAEGLVVYFGVMPAEVVRGHPLAHPESQMHGRGHESPGEKHVVIALFDAATGARITDATVSARVVGSAAPARALERMTVAGATSYGNYLPLAGTGSRQIRIEITRPGQGKTAVVTFDYPLTGA
ncbi:hypothetical protein [Immundisolibacter cernigliae]|nr:hypothetical protein [Immundisolibacter cernigliae]